MNESSSIPPMPITRVSAEKYEGHVAVSPERFAFVPSKPSLAARPGSRTIHIISAIASGPIESAASENQVTLLRRSLRNSVASTRANITRHLP
ncbi:MAG: hypothetical protein ABSC36_06415 [Gaiellaceae bacterium]